MYGIFTIIYTVCLLLSFNVKIEWNSRGYTGCPKKFSRNLAHTEPLFEIHLLDVQGVRT